ncbi:hypothetical protein Mapa_015764 [Marchantia paleacea]|nr:hypothetical protein Mapa_015764 [Marchantia paleacea]
MNSVRAEQLLYCTEDSGGPNLTGLSNSYKARSSARTECRRRGVSSRCSDRLLVGTGVAFGADQNTRAGCPLLLTRAAFAKTVVSAGSRGTLKSPMSQLYITIHDKLKILIFFSPCSLANFLPG